MPKLSIIMPVYNTAKYLDRGIQAVINQTFTDWELIIVNDGSIDNSAEICAKYAGQDTRIIFIDKKNGGAGSARNAGLDVARGEYIAFPDSDDWLEYDTYEICMQRIVQTPVDLLLFGEITTVYNDRTGSIEKEIEDFIEENHFTTKDECREKWSELIMTYHMNAPWNKIYKKSIIDRYHIRFPDLRRMQDGVFNLYYYDKIESFISITEYKYHFIWHSDEVQKKKMPAAFLDCAITYHSTAIKLLDEWGKKNQTIEKKLGNWFSETLSIAEQTFIPQGGKTPLNTYKHIRKINNNQYVRDFFKGYSKIVNLSKTEYAMANRWNFLLTVISLIRT